LDRDWYTGAEEGGVAGDEVNNPLAHYEDLSALKEVEKATKQVVSIVLLPTTDSLRYADVLLVCRKRYLQDRHNMSVFHSSRTRLLTIC
jgi:hypothetical protein